MRIFFVTNNFTPYSGGVIQSITATTNALREQGHTVFIITLNFLGKHHDDPEYVIRISCPIKFMYKKNHMAIPWRPTHAITQLIKKYKPDIIHVHHPFLLGSSALRAARKHNIACVFTYHTLYEQYTHYVPLPRTCVQPIIRATVHRFCNKVDAIIAPSTSVKNFLLSQKITTPITVIPSPLRKCFTTRKKTILPCARPELVEGYPRALEEILQQVQDERGEELRDFKLLLVTRFVPEKNIPFVFEVLKLLPNNFHLTLAGYGTDYEELQKLACETYAFSPSHIRFVNKPSQEILLNLYRTSDMFIFPSTTDTQGIVLAESMSQGLPVIALDGPGQRDIIIDGVNGFIVASAQQTADKIISLAHNPTLLEELALNARATARKYHANSIIKQLLNVYMRTTEV